MSKKNELEKLKKIQKLKEAEKAAVSQGVRNVNLNTSNDEKDARMEREVGKKYKDISPYFSKGVFSSYTKYNTTPDNISASDNTQKRKNKSKKEKITTLSVVFYCQNTRKGGYPPPINTHIGGREVLIKYYGLPYPEEEKFNG